MSYNTISSAKDFVGVTFTEAQLNAAQSLIHAFTDLRWKDTTVTRRFSRSELQPSIKDSRAGLHFGHVLTHRVMYLNYPITTFTSLSEIDEEDDDETALTRFDDYDFDKETGQLDIFSGSSSSTIYNNFEVVYTYGYDANNEFFAVVRFAEAQLALMMKKNPLLLSTISLSGDSYNYGNNPIGNILMNVPKPPRFIGLGGTPLRTLT